MTVSWGAFKAQRNRVTSVQRKAKREYFHHLISNNAHPSKLWNALKAAGVSSSPLDNWSSFSTSLSVVADHTLNNHFVSVSSSDSNASLFLPLLCLLLNLLCL